MNVEVKKVMHTLIFLIVLFCLMTSSLLSSFSRRGVHFDAFQSRLTKGVLSKSFKLQASIKRSWSEK